MAWHEKSFETPQDLWDAFVKYAEEVKANPRLKTVFVGKDGEQKLEPLLLGAFAVAIAHRGVSGDEPEVF